MIKIIISKNIDLDKEIFLKYFFNESYLKKRGHVKKLIIKYYKVFQNKIDELDEHQKTKEIIDKFLDEKYLFFSDKIDFIMNKWEETFNFNKKEIEIGFNKTMGYDLSNDMIYLYPSFLPVFTFGKDSISLSIVMEVFKDLKVNYLDVFLHEMTHIIWEKKLLNHKNILQLREIGYDYLKEFIPPIIIRDSIWDNIREGNKHKYANIRQQLLKINVDNKVYDFIDYLELIFLKNKKKGLSFDKTISEYINIFIDTQEQIENKHKIFDEISYNDSNKDESLKLLKSKGFLDPIIIKK